SFCCVSSTFSMRPSSTFFFFYATSTTVIYTLSLHDALPIFLMVGDGKWSCLFHDRKHGLVATKTISRILTYFDNRLDTNSFCGTDRKSTRLNSSHVSISYAVFCLKKKTISYISRFK